MKVKEFKDCKVCGTEFKMYRTTDKYCSPNCMRKDPKFKQNISLKEIKPIRQVSKKQQILNSKYLVLNKEFLSKPENQICPVTGEKATEIHHKKGRKGFADDWARENNIPLLIDVRFFLAVSRKGHMKIELEPEWAKEMGYSVNRIKDG